MPKTIMEWLELECFWKTYKLNLTKWEYAVNGRTYFWLYDSEDWEPFCDLTENHTEISDEQVYWRLPWHEGVIIDHDFLMCFDEPRLAKIWIKDNIKECIITGDIDWLDCFYVKKE